jgi:NAD(P)-dependent dehydrogenase (short-subunit alcohol dehydrogenase family)
VDVGCGDWAAGRVMIGQGSGRIISIGSQAGAVALPGEPVYCMTKAAIAHLTSCLAVEWGSHGITGETILVDGGWTAR